MRPLATDTIYAPPWHDHDLEYGPDSADAYDRAIRRYQDSRAGGGLWDDGTYFACRYSRPAPSQSMRRDDALSAWVGEHAHALSRLELAVYLLLYEDRMSISGAAKQAGVIREHVVRAHRAILIKAGVVQPIAVRVPPATV